MGTGSGAGAENVEVKLAQNPLLAAKNADVDSYSGALSAAALALATGSVDSIPAQAGW